MANRSKLEPIAVVGVSALFPGSVNKDGFWKDILAGTDLMTDVPASHWLIDDYYDADPSKPDKTYAKRGGFLPDVDFDPIAWGIPPSIVPATDTAQLLALIVAKQVLDDASQNQFASMDRERMSCILGVTSAQELLASMVSRLQRPVWVKALRESGVGEDEVQGICDKIVSNYSKWDESTFPGLLGNVVAGRIANRLDLGGTNCVTDAACASTFSALSMAVNELWLGQSDIVICGGVDTMNDIFMYMCFSKTPALSPSGDCKPFSAQADGTMLGEGIGMVALRRLSDAERDGDRVYAVITGVGSSSDGRAKSVYAPVPQGQAKALRRAYEMAGYGCETVELMEAHGTGTKAGDAAEFEGLRTVFDESGRADRQWCQIGSVKSQIGHTKAAAGAAGLVKAVLALHAKTLPPTIKVEQPNPKLALDKSPFHVTTRARPWARPANHPRRASVSSFGFGGSNFHIALEEYEGPAKAAYRVRALDSELVVLTGATAADVAAQARSLVKDAAEPGLLAFLARSTQTAYTGSENARLAIIATATDLAEKLTKGAELADKGVSASTPNGIFFGVGGRQGDVGFVFPGQGSQSIDMGAHIAMTFDDAAHAWDLTRKVDFGADVSLHEVVYPKTVFNPADKAANDARLTATEWAQPAIGAASLALLELTKRIGLSPVAVAGHSFGEVTALHAAGAITDADLLRIARKRGELMRDAAANTSGSMTAVVAKIEDLRPKLEAWGIDVVVANHNAPEQVVLSGATSAIEAVEKKLADAGITAKRLNVATAFHSKLVSPSTVPFRAFLEGIDVSAPSLDVFANATAAPYGSDVAGIRAQLGEQIANSVRFVECVEAMYARGVRTFVEVGPGAVLSGLVGRILKGRPHRAVALDRSGRDGVTAFYTGIAQLVADGESLALGTLWEAFAPLEDPRTTTKPKLLLKINGANYGKPYPPKGGSAALPKPNKKSTITVGAPSVATLSADVTKPVVHANGTNGNGNGKNGGSHAATTTPARTEARVVAAAGAGGLQMISGSSGGSPRAQLSAEGAPTQQPAQAQQAPSVIAAQPAAANGAWLDAYRAAQSSAAEAHSAYQRAMAETHSAFLRTAEASIHGLTSLVTGTRPAAPATYAPAPVFAPAPVAAAPVFAAPAPVYAPAPVAAPAPAYAPAPVAAPVAPRAEVKAPAPVAAPRVENVVAKVAAPAAPSLDIEKLLMVVVAEKTGYPEEMLAAGMDLEADLGVDSIKRVEILSTMRERAPSLPDVDAGEMAKLRTLGQIVDYMRSKLPAGAATAAPAVVASSTAPKPTPTAPGVDIEKLLMVVVAEKTGYPEEMLAAGMDLEADLGVDSIKRVEILSTMRERAPGLPDVDAGEMAKLRTLGQIVDYMRGKLPAGASTPAPVAAATTSAPSQAPAGLDIEKLLMVVVAEKTGYPEEMLGAGMDLEADLGVDSIKRVEILSTMRERAPGLPDVDAGEMAKLRTLGQIVDYMRGKLPVGAAKPAAAPAAAAAAHAAGGTDVHKLLMVVVAEKTGYPEEMLGGGMDLEADLGVDSIKRVEILSTMRERAPGLPDVDAGEMAKLRTLGQIVDYMQSRLPQSSGASRLSGAPGTAPAAPAQKVVDPRLGRFVTRRVTAAPSGFSLRGLFDAKRVAVTEDGNGVAAALVAELRARGVPAEAVSTIPDDVDGVIFLGGLRDVVDVSNAVDVNREAFRAAKVVAGRASTTGGCFVTVQDTGGDFGLAGTPRAWLGGLPGLVKTAAQEWPKAGLRAIDLERGGRTASVIAMAIANELVNGGTELEVGLSADGERTTLVSLREDIPEANSPINAQSVVVASGGARGVTAATLIALARATKCRIVLLGRTALADEPACCVGKNTDADLKRALLDDARARGAAITPASLGAEVAKVLANREVRENVQAIRAAGGDALYVAADVQDADALRATLADVRAKWGPITAIVHGAGVLADRFITDKTEEQFDRVFDTKIAGLRVLLAATREDPIDTMCFFSSVAARSGNQGQCDYAMANEVLNKVAASERARRGGNVVVKSLGWGPWAGGMVTPQLKARFEALGVPLIPLDVGADMLVRELTFARPDDVEMCMGGEPKPEALLTPDASEPERFEIHVDARSHAFLDGHRVKGAPVVPVVLVAEWFARAAASLRPDLEFVALETVRVLKGIVLANFDGAGDRFLIEAKKLSNGAGATYALELKSASGAKHYQATAVLAKERSIGAVPAVPAGLAAFAGPVYGDVLFHGASFQVIRSLDGMSKDGVSASLVGTREVGWGGEGFRMDPALLDGGLQLALLWTQHTLGGASLPTGLSGIRVHRGGLVAGVQHVILRAREARGDRGVCDIVFIAADGAPVASLEGVETHVLPGTRVTA